MKCYILLPIFCITLFSCASKENKASTIKHEIELKINQSELKDSINWNQIEIASLPFKTNILLRSGQNKLVDSAEWTNFKKWGYNVDSLFHYFKVYNKQKKLNNLFSDQTVMRHQPWEYFGKPSKQQGCFLMRFPNVNKNKVLLYAVYDPNIDIELGEKSAWLELQIFDEHQLLLDKMIVFMYVANECDFQRVFTYNLDNSFDIIDVSYCNDTDENATLLSQTTNVFRYKISESGKIIEQTQQ